MSAEFFVTFEDPSWFRKHRSDVVSRLEGLSTFIKLSGNELWFRGKENGSAGRFPIDVRIFLQPDGRILLEVSAHPQSIEADLKSFLGWLRSETSIQVLDEDGEKSGW